MTTGTEVKAGESGLVLTGTDDGMSFAMRSMQGNPAWPLLSRLPVTLTARIPAVAFAVRNLLALSVGQTIRSEWPVTEDLPLRAGDMQIGWSEFEVVKDRLALRITRLA